MKTWKQYTENIKELAKNYSNALKNVPQDPVHHREGNALIHTQLVRKAIPKAIQELKILQQTPELSNILSNIDFSISNEELKILYLSAWLHDIGKATATTIGGQPWTNQGASGKIQSIGHQDAKHYLPQLEKLKNFAPSETFNLYIKNKDLINFIIEHHMDFTSGTGFSKSFVSKHFDGEKVKNTPEMKMLLILMWADKMGRKPEETIADAIEKNVKNLYASSEKSQKILNNIKNQSKSFEGSPEEFAQILKLKQMNKNQKIQALKGKFPFLNPEQLDKLTENFKTFISISESF